MPTRAASCSYGPAADRSGGGAEWRRYLPLPGLPTAHWQRVGAGGGFPLPYTVSGRSTSYVRTSDAGCGFVYYFCTVCTTTVIHTKRRRRQSVRGGRRLRRSRLSAAADIGVRPPPPPSRGGAAAFRDRSVRARSRLSAAPDASNSFIYPIRPTAKDARQATLAPDARRPLSPRLRCRKSGSVRVDARTASV